MKTAIWRAPAPGWRRSVPPGFIRPCAPALVPYPPAGPGWLHEIKHDGFRIMARRDGAGVGLTSRQGSDFTSRFPLIVAAISALPRRSFLLDGEAIVTDGDGGLSLNFWEAVVRGCSEATSTAS